MNYKGVKDTIFVCKNCNTDFKFRGYSNRNVFCGIPCSKEYNSNTAKQRFEDLYNLWLEDKDLGINNPRKLIKKFVEKRDGYKCKCCGLTEWLGKDIVLWCDHIDGDATNNKSNNFRLVCPNCDSQSATFGGKNYGKGRKSRGLPQYG